MKDSAKLALLHVSRPLRNMDTRRSTACCFSKLHRLQTASGAASARASSWAICSKRSETLPSQNSQSSWHQKNLRQTPVFENHGMRTKRTPHGTDWECVGSSFFWGFVLSFCSCCWKCGSPVSVQSSRGSHYRRGRLLESNAGTPTSVPVIAFVSFWRQLGAAHPASQVADNEMLWEQHCLPPGISHARNDSAISGLFYRNPMPRSKLDSTWRRHQPGSCSIFPRFSKHLKEVSRIPAHLSTGPVQHIEFSATLLKPWHLLPSGEKGPCRAGAIVPTTGPPATAQDVCLRLAHHSIGAALLQGQGNEDVRLDMVGPLSPWWFLWPFLYICQCCQCKRASISDDDFQQSNRVPQQQAQMPFSLCSGVLGEQTVYKVPLRSTSFRCAGENLLAKLRHQSWSQRILIGSCWGSSWSPSAGHWAFGSLHPGSAELESWNCNRDRPSLRRRDSIAATTGLRIRSCQWNIHGRISPQP